MSQQTIGTSSPDDGLGTKLRDSFNIVNQNFTEIYDNKVDKVTGESLTPNKYTTSEQTKLSGIETGAQVNVRGNMAQNDDTQPDYIFNKQNYVNGLGYFDYNDTATTATPLTLVANTPKKLTNNTLGVLTRLSASPYGVTSIWNSTTNQFEFTQLSIDDTLEIRVDCALTTSSANQTYSLYLKMGIGSATPYDIFIDNQHIKTASTVPVIGDVGFYIGSANVRDYPAELYIVSDSSGSVVVNGWYVRIIRKNLNIVDIPQDALGTWNAATNTPTLANGTGVRGQYYYVSVAGNLNLGSGLISYKVNDRVEYNGTTWFNSVNNNQAGGVVTTYKTATASNLTTQDIAGFLTYINGVTSFAIAANEIVKYTITDTQQIFEIKSTGTARSVGSGQAALVSTDVLEIQKSKIFNVQNYANWRFLKADALGGAQGAIHFISNFGWATVGTASLKTSTFAAGNFIDTVRRVGIVSAASAGSTASRITNSGVQCSTLSGFYVCVDSVYSDAATVATTRAAIGIGDLASGIGNVEPSTKGSCILLGKDTSDTNMQIMHNDTGGACTKVDLGSNFPANTNNTDVYRLELFCFTAGTAIYYKVTRLNTGHVYESVITTNYPPNNSPLLFILHRNNGSTALAVDYAFSQILIATPY